MPAQEQTKPRVVDPPLNELDSLRQPLTEGERRVLDWFLNILPPSWEIYIQPHLNGLRPDFVLLSPKKGIAVYEVKDWNLQDMQYFVGGSDSSPKLMARKDGKSFSLASSDPVAKIDLYKKEIFELYVPSLPSGKGLQSITAGIIFTNAPKSEVVSLLEPLREHRNHTKYEKFYPIIGSDLIGDCSDSALDQLLNSHCKINSNMNDKVTSELRHWLVEPSFAADQRVPLAKLMTQRQRSICLNQDGARFRRLKGPAGSGKSMVIAGRAVELARQNKRVLVVTFNITLINYLNDLMVQYAQSGKVRKQITTLNFHTWCKRIASLTGNYDAYNALWRDNKDNETRVLESDLASKAVEWAKALDDDERWDAILIDEGQDFMPSWWTALRAAFPINDTGEALIAADRQQNIYGVQPWTEAVMEGSGFRGRWLTLENSFRLSPALSRLASVYVDKYLPNMESHRPVSPEGEFEFRTVLRWKQIESKQLAASACVEALLEILIISENDPVSVSDLVCIVDREEIGREVVRQLINKKIRTICTFGESEDKRICNDESRRKKQAFYKGDARVKVTTIQSFKGWESKALVLQISDVSGESGLALAYTGITRLKRDDRGCFLTVVCSAPELQDYGKMWSS